MAVLATSARNPHGERLEVSLTQKGRDIREQCGCLGEALLAKSGMTVEALGALNRQVQALRDAVAP